MTTDTNGGTPMESIQRGDQVYYRGEVWKVQDVWEVPGEVLRLFLVTFDAGGSPVRCLIEAEKVQRVEQVR